jgi:kinesin family protein C1
MLQQDMSASKASLADMELTIAVLREESEQFDSIRRYMHNLIQELKGNIRVFVRIRPPMRENIVRELI